MSLLDTHTNVAALSGWINISYVQLIETQVFSLSNSRLALCGEDLLTNNLPFAEIFKNGTMV